MKARKENKVYTIDKTNKEKFLKDGYDIYDDDGRLIANAKNKTVPYEEYEKVVKELAEVKALLEEKTKAKQTAKGKEPTKAEIVAQLTELGIEFEENATKAELVELLPKTEETEEE